MVNCQYSVLKTPVQLKPIATIGDVEIHCCDEACISVMEHSEQECCQIVVSQKVLLKIPITYKITATSGEGSMEFVEDKRK